MNLSRDYNIENLHNKILEIMVVFDRFCRDNDIQYYMLGGTMLGAYRHKGFIPWDDDIDVGIPRPDYERFLELAEKKMHQPYKVRNNRNTPNCPYCYTRLENINSTYIEVNKDENIYLGGVYIEIFPLDGASDSSIKRQLQAKRIYLNKYILFGAYTSLESKRRSVFKTAIIRGIKYFYKIENLTKKLCRIISRYDYEDSSYACNHIGHWGIKESIPKSDFEPAQEFEFEGYKFYGVNNPNAYLTSLYGENYMQPPSIEEQEKGKHEASYMNLDLPYEEYKTRIQKEK